MNKKEKFNNNLIETAQIFSLYYYLNFDTCPNGRWIIVFLRLEDNDDNTLTKGFQLVNYIIV